MSTDPSAKPNGVEPEVKADANITGGSLPSQKPPAEEDLYVATDKEMIIWFFANNITFVRKLKKTGYKTVFWFDREKIADALRRWQSPEPLMIDARILFAAERIFYSAIHDD